MLQLLTTVLRGSGLPSDESGDATACHERKIEKKKNEKRKSKKHSCGLHRGKTITGTDSCGFNQGD